MIKFEVPCDGLRIGADARSAARWLCVGALLLLLHTETAAGVACEAFGVAGVCAERTLCGREAPLLKHTHFRSQRGTVVGCEQEAASVQCCVPDAQLVAPPEARAPVIGDNGGEPLHVCQIAKLLYDAGLTDMSLLEPLSCTAW